MPFTISDHIRISSDQRAYSQDLLCQVVLSLQLKTKASKKVLTLQTLGHWTKTKKVRKKDK